MDPIQLLSLLGAFAILVAFGASQAKWIKQTSLSYSVLNFVGSAILGIVALIGSQWGFVVLEVAWALISLWAIIKYMGGQRA